MAGMEIQNAVLKAQVSATSKLMQQFRAGVEVGQGNHSSHSSATHQPQVLMTPLGPPMPFSGFGVAGASAN